MGSFTLRQVIKTTTTTMGVYQFPALFFLDYRDVGAAAT
jgi:hypothetical protein